MDENKKEHHLHIVLTTQQYQLLCCQAKECRLTKRAYLARLIEGRPVKARPRTTERRCCMGTKKKFTPEELKHLQANPYTLRVTADSISYTLAFKEAFWALSLQGYTGTAAFRKLGYNTEVLGFERIHNTTKRIRREARSPEGFHEGARGGVRIPGGGNNQTEGASAPSDEAARRMKREILCLQQQMAFLKKVMRLHGKPGE